MNYNREWWFRYIYLSIIALLIGSHLGNSTNELLLTLVIGLVYYILLFWERIIEIYHSTQIKYWKCRLRWLKRDKTKKDKITFTISDIKIINKILMIMMFLMIPITMIVGLIYTASMYFGVLLITFLYHWFFKNLEGEK